MKLDKGLSCWGQGSKRAASSYVLWAFHGGSSVNPNDIVTLASVFDKVTQQSIILPRDNKLLYESVNES